MEPATTEDSFIGQRFGEGGHLEVVGWDGRVVGGNKTYSVKCHVCAKDSELHGDAVFYCAKNNLKRGAIPCGCAKFHKWTPEQYRTRILRKCADKGFSLIEIINPEENSDALLRLSCNKDGYSWKTDVTAFLNKASGCKRCRAQNMRKIDSEYVRNFTATDKFTKGTKFVRDHNSEDVDKSWDIFCPVCSNDEYVKAGVCSGIFRSSGNALSNGCVPCRCSPNFRMTEAMQVYRLNKMAKEDDEHFVRWVDGYSSVKSKCVMHCVEHGDFETYPHMYVSMGSRCPECCVTGFNPSKPAVVYVIRACGAESSFTGFGITTNLTKRLQAHRRNLDRSGFVISEMEVFESSGVVCQEVENLIKSSFEIAAQNVDGFKTEATHYHNYDELIKFVEVNINLQEKHNE